MSTDLAGLPSAEPGRASKSRTLGTYEALRAEILDCRLRPGTRLHVAALARRFAVSQSAVREALSRLVADGLAHAIDQRGFRVSPVSPRDLQDVTATRIDIEGLALRRAIERGNAAWEAEIVASVHVLQRATPQRVSEMGATLPAWTQLHERFHRALVSACGSSWLLRFRKTLYEQSERYRSLTVTHATGDRDVAREHAGLAEAVLDRDAEQAVRLLGDHFNTTMQMLMDAYRAGADVLSDERD
jgi:GntR family carbon starvation induced transcriptional regulator